MTFIEVETHLYPNKPVENLRLQEIHQNFRCPTMERLLNQHDKEYMKMAMLKQEETFREQVYELHRLYRIQKMLMKDVAKIQQCRSSNPTAGVNSESEYDDGDLELTLGPRSYYQKTGVQSEERSFSRRRQQKWGPEKPVSGQDRLKSPPWLLQAISMNTT